ncbi:MAG TPA: RcnB family protein [Allosphingosinicella sp.]|nr:RcnB family protein [Allosphingosinicella sp.]
MKPFLCAVAAIALIGSGAASAQPPEHRHGGEHAQRPPSRPARPAAVRPQVRPPAARPVARPAIAAERVRPARPVRARPQVEIRRVLPARVSRRPGARPQNFHPIRRPAFHYPRGYRYRRWSVGLILPRLFLSNVYYFGDWADLGLGPPPPGYVWVRYGPDLLLVNRYTGRIRDVVYGAFY